MILVSAENLFRICPRGVMSKNLKKSISSNIRYFVALTFRRWEAGCRRSSFPSEQDVEVLPDGGVDDLVQQVVVQVGGWRKTQKLHCEWGDETQHDPCSAQDDEDQKVGVVLPSQQHMRKFSGAVTEIDFIKSWKTMSIWTRVRVTVLFYSISYKM